MNENVESVEMRPQEFTYVNKLAGLAVFRLENGDSKKVLIEIQKARNHIDLMRFRNYLAEQYKKEDKIDKEKVILPITTIYILGFNLPKIDSACIHVERQYRDMVNQTIIGAKSDFIEKLTHDSYVVQVERITDRYKSKLDKVLSVFEQSNFIDDTEIIKEFKHTVQEEDVKLMTDILHHSGTDLASRKLIEIEKEAWRTVNAMFEDKEREFYKKLKENNEVIDKQQQELSEKDKLIEELKRKLNDKSSEK